MRNRTTEEVIKGKQLYALFLRSTTNHLYHDYFIGFYKYQCELFIAATPDFSNENIKCFLTIKGAKKTAEKLFENYFKQFHDWIYIVNQDGKQLMVFDGKEWKDIKE